MVLGLELLQNWRQTVRVLTRHLFTGALWRKMLAWTWLRNWSWKFLTSSKLVEFASLVVRAETWVSSISAFK